jgi:hypothetical protein
MEWKGRYLKDEFGTYLTEEIECIEGNIVDEITGKLVPNKVKRIHYK